jgi:hypothetical protein
MYLEAVYRNTPVAVAATYRYTPPLMVQLLDQKHAIPP